MKKIITLILVLSMIASLCSVAYAEKIDGNQLQQTWAIMYESMDLPTDDLSRDNYTNGFVLCLELMLKEIQLQNQTTSVLASGLSSVKSSDSTEELEKKLSLVNDSFQDENYNEILSYLKEAENCYTTGSFSWGILKKRAYYHGYYGTDKFDEEKYNSME
jgi:hypothetical protein